MNFHVDSDVEVVLRQIVKMVVEVGQVFVTATLQKRRCDGQSVLVLQKNVTVNFKSKLYSNENTTVGMQIKEGMYRNT